MLQAPCARSQTTIGEGRRRTTTSLRLVPPRRRPKLLCFALIQLPHPCPQVSESMACGVSSIRPSVERKNHPIYAAPARVRCPSSIKVTTSLSPSSPRAHIAHTSRPQQHSRTQQHSMADDDTLNTTTTTTGGGIIFDTYTDWWIFLTITVVCWSVVYGVVSKSMRDVAERERAA